MAPETAHHIQMKRPVLQSVGAQNLPIFSGPSQCYHSPLRERIWQSEDGDFFQATFMLTTHFKTLGACSKEQSE